MKFNIEIKGNVNQVQIDNLINFYLHTNELNNEIVYDETGEVFESIKINLIPHFIDDEINLELDPIYLGYLVLILQKFTFLKVEIIVENNYIKDLIQNFNAESYTKGSKISDRAYSIYDQIQYLKDNSVLKERISFNAEYYNKENRTINNVVKKFESSKRFFPIILISSREDIDKYFNSNFKDKGVVDKIYLDKIIEIIKPAIAFNLTELSRIQLYILRILLTDDNIENKNLNKVKIEFYIDYCKQLSYSLKELAINIVEHSRITNNSENGLGVITGRIFDKKRMANLKGEDENDFLNSFDKNEFFLDINVFDLGCQSLRDKYVENIEINIKNNYSGIHNFENDKEIIKNTDFFLFKDFYIPNLKTEHQSNKIISRYGIQYFTQLCTKRFEGYIKAISHSEGVIITGSEQTIKNISKTRYGTSYNCILPISKFNYYFNQNKKKTGKLLGQSTDMYSQLIKYNKPNKFSNINIPTEYDILIFDEYPTNNEGGKYEYNNKIKTKFFEIFSAVKDNIICIDAQNNLNFNASGWIRLLANLTLDFPNLIVYNIDKEITREIIDIRRVVSNSIDEYNFWNNDSCVIFYSYQKHKQDELFYRYGATALTGTDEAEYNFVNKNIWKCHYSYYKDFIVNDSDRHINLNNKFFVNGNLLSFDLLISVNDENGSSISLFEKSLQYALNKPLEDNLDKDTNNKGYKIVDTHFRLGSKIHIDNFYYAKRVFQNSFFATPLAFIIAKSIQSEIEILNSKVVNKKRDYTILGYESYSEFLVSVIRKLLTKIYESKVNYYFNHNTINTDSKLSRSIESIQGNIFIVVPIASTFSTSIKIKKDTQDILQRNRNGFVANFIEPHFNIVLVGENEFENSVDGDKEVKIDSLIKDFGWEKIDPKDKIVEIKEYSESKGNLVKEKYFIPVYSHWYKAENCIHCFPIYYKDERCLIETGTSSITPRLVFGFPKTKPDNSQNSKLDLIGSLLYGNLRKGDNKYLYFTRVGEIINKRVDTKLQNLELIKTWLEKSVKESFKSKIDDNKKIVLVTPSTSTKSNFIDLVNEIVFNYSANCLTISIGEDYIENSDSLYSDGLYKADVVVFVDDVLSTIKSFVDTNKIINYIRKKNESGNGIDYCISLINRMTFENEENLLLKLTNIQLDKITDLSKSKENLIYYCKINNPAISEPNKKFPLSTESNRYNFLSKISSLDSTRSIFHSKYVKLKKHDIVNRNIDLDTKFFIDDEIAYGNKKLFQLLILDKIYTLFEYKDNQYSNYNVINYFKITSKQNPLESFNKLVIEISKEFYDSDKKVIQKHKVHEKVLERYINNIDFVILKIICSTPLIYYKQIRESAFSWVLKYIDLCINGCIDYNLIGINNLNIINLVKYFEVSWNNNYSEFQKLKFLLKRAVQLKSNIIIHKDFFIAIEKLISLLYDNYAAIKEIKTENETKLIELIKNLFQTDYKKGYLELFDYVDYLKRSKVISAETIKSSISLSERDVYEEYFKNYRPPNANTLTFEDINKVTFDKQFTELKIHKKYRITNSKSLIYNLIVLIKELIYEHEPKAIELESKILEHSTSSNDFKNGTFKHYLRLLQIENTSAIDSFYEKEKDRLNAKILNNQQINYIEGYQNNPVFKSIKLLINQGNNEDPEYNSFNSFLKIKSNLDNWLNDKNRDFTIDKQIKQIQVLLIELIGKDIVNEVNLSVNYKYNSELSSNDIFFFDSKSNTTKQKYLYDFINESDISNSLNFKMYEGVKEFDFDFPLSNLEIIKSHANYIFRENTNLQNNFIENSLEFNRITQNCNLLFLRISDFVSDNSTQNNQSNLKAIAVFTIYLNSTQRIAESTLRLLLLLRNPLCQFLSKQLKGHSLLEFIEAHKAEKERSLLRHSLDLYLSNLTDAYRDRADDIFDIISSAIRGQLDAHKLENNVVESISLFQLKYRFDLIHNSATIEENIINNCLYEGFENDLELNFDSFIYNIVFVELLINMKRYSPNLNRGFIISYIKNENTIIFQNNIDQEKVDNSSSGYGTHLCEKICKKLNKTIYIDKSINSKYKVTIKL